MKSVTTIIIIDIKFPDVPMRMAMTDFALHSQPDLLDIFSKHSHHFFHFKIRRTGGAKEGTAGSSSPKSIRKHESL